MSEYFVALLAKTVELDRDKDILEIYGEGYRRLRDLAEAVGEDWRSILLTLPDRVPWTHRGGLLYTPYLWFEADDPETWKREARLFGCDCAERVLHIFEEANPDDDRPRRAIEVARRYAVGEATEVEMRQVHYAAINAAAAASSASAASFYADSAAFSAATAANPSDDPGAVRRRAAAYHASIATDRREDERDAQWKMLVDRLCREK